MTHRHKVPLLPQPPTIKCMGALPLGIPNANALRGKYAVMRHAYEKVHWRYVHGMGIVSLDPTCIGKARFGESGEKLSCNPCYEVPRNKTLCNWMRQERNAKSSTEHFKLRFLKLAKRANAHRADKNTTITALRRVSHVCETVVQKCDAHQALICAIGADDRPLASLRAARLIAAGQSAAAVLEDLSKAIQIRSYNETDRDLACLVAIGIGGGRTLCALNRAGRLPSEDVSREWLHLDPPLQPNQPPTVEFIVSRLPKVHWQIAPTSCAHHCYRKTNMASPQKEVAHIEPLLCPVPGCGHWEFRYNMPAHLRADDTHKEFPFTLEQKAKLQSL